MGNGRRLILAVEAWGESTYITVRLYVTRKGHFANYAPVPPKKRLSDIGAMEVYHGISTPIEYGFGSCGVVLIWTR